MFFTALITPAILLVLYATFLGSIYRDAFTSGLPEGLKISDKVLDALVGGQLVSSILAVSCITVAFCSNFLMVQDKANGCIRDLTISPVSPTALSISYYIATLISTLTICFVSMVVCLLYLAVVGWYLTVLDVILMIADVILLVFFGTAISSIINFFLSSQGQISAVGTIISSGYGFICGAYMPISNFPDGLQKAVMLLPGTYGTSLLRNHALRGMLAELEKQIPKEIVDVHKQMLDIDVEFFGSAVSEPAKFIILGVTVAVLVSVYVVMNIVKMKKAR
jgi:multidrug/hemolysin transport system permease protein